MSPGHPDPAVPPGSPDPALNDLVARVQRMVGDSFEEVDEELADRFEETQGDLEVPDGLIERIDTLPSTVPAGLPPHNESRLFIGSAAHAFIAKATERRNEDLLAEIRSLAQNVRECLLGLAAAGLASGGDETLPHRLEAVADGLERLESTLSVAVGRIEDLEDRLERFERGRDVGSFRPWFSQVDFEDAFRGERSALLDRYDDLADLLASTGGPVLDLGCGRGELLELLTERGVTAWGVDQSDELVEFCRTLGLDARTADAGAALAQLEDEQLGGISLIHMVEHLTAQQLTDLVPLLRSKVRPGGLVIVETPNPTSPYIFSHSFYLDPTHTTPVHPAYLEFLFANAGFSKIEIQWREPVPESDRPTATLEPVPEAEAASPGEQALEVLDHQLFGPQDYALIATR